MIHRRLLCVVQNSPLWLTQGVKVPPRSEVPEWATGVDVAWYVRKHGQELSTLEGSVCVDHYRRNVSQVLVSPNLTFDERWYRNRYPDVVDAILSGRFASGWHHYLSVGCSERLNPVWWFDERWYARRYPEAADGVRSAGLTCGFEHYLLYGINQDLSPSLFFNAPWYRRQYLTDNSDRNAKPGILDYLLARNRDRRCPAPFFDSFWYRSSYLNENACEESCPGQQSALEHYVFHGQMRGHSPSPLFNELAYREMNEGVVDQIASGQYCSGFQHYVEEGVANGAAVQTHMPTCGIDYGGPEFLQAYEQSLCLNLRQLYVIRQLSGRVNNSHG